MSNLSQFLGAKSGFTLAPLAGGTLLDKNTIYTFGAAAAYTLPDLTGSTNFGLAMLSNSPAAPTTITTSDGWTIAHGFAANTLKVCQPILAYNAHGWWGNVGMTPPAVISAVFGAAPTVYGYAVLSATCHVVMYGRASNTYAMAFNPVANTRGSEVVLGVLGVTTYAAIYADTATTFLAFVSSPGASFARAGSVSGGTITLGTATAALDNWNGLSDTPLQLAAGSYFVATRKSVTTDLVALSVSGTTITVGTAVASGCDASKNGVKCEKITSTTVLIVYPTLGALESQFRARVVTVSGSTISSVGTAVDSTGAATIESQNTDLIACRAFAAAGPFIIGAADYATNDKNFRGLTVSGTVPTWGANVTLADASGLVLSTWFMRDTFPHQPISQLSSKFMVYSATQVLMPVPAASSMQAWSISGATLTAGASTGSYTNVKYATDFARTAFYEVDNAAFRKITVSGTTITVVETQSVTPTVIGTTTSNDKSFYYGSTWYAWTGFPTFLFAISATEWLCSDATTLSVYEVSV